MIAHVKDQLPGPKSREYLALSDQYEARCINQQAPIVWERGEGVVVTDVDGNKYIDFTSGVLVTNVGHSHPKHVDASTHRFPIASGVLSRRSRRRANGSVWSFWTRS